MMDNTPLEFITDHLDVRLDLWYLVPGQPDPLAVPDHDVAMVALGESSAHGALLERARGLLEHWPRPVVNPPQRIANCARDAVSALLQGIASVHVPATRRLRRESLHAQPTPYTVRPIDTQAGHGLHRIRAAHELHAYLAAFDAAEHYVAEYVECRDPDGFYRKMRVALIDGEPYACHLAIAEDWIVHYRPAGMDASAAKRAEEAAWMARFEHDFAVRHGPALRAIARALGLDYVVLDCADGRDGRLLVFEADSRAWIHASESDEVFAYKKPVMQKAFDAFRAMLQRRVDAAGKGRA
jgi:glutathione synthase/RimK-type ligase-like ATP-grasp enzyme